MRARRAAHPRRARTGPAAAPSTPLLARAGHRARHTAGEALGAGYASVAAVVYDRDLFGAVLPAATMANDNSARMGRPLRAGMTTRRCASDAALPFTRRSIGSGGGMRARGLLVAVEFMPDAVAALQVATDRVQPGSVPPARGAAPGSGGHYGA